MIQTGHEYDIRIEVTGRIAKLYLDNVLWGTVDDTPADPIYSVVTKDAKSGDTIVKVVNTSAERDSRGRQASPVRPTLPPPLP